MQYVVHGCNNVQRAQLIQLPAWAGTRCRDYDDDDNEDDDGDDLRQR